MGVHLYRYSFIDEYIRRKREGNNQRNVYHIFSFYDFISYKVIYLWRLAKIEKEKRFM